MCCVTKYKFLVFLIGILCNFYVWVCNLYLWSPNSSLNCCSHMFHTLIHPHTDCSHTKLRSWQVASVAIAHRRDGQPLLFLLVSLPIEFLCQPSAPLLVEQPGLAWVRNIRHVQQETEHLGTLRALQQAAAGMELDHVTVT